MRSKRGRGRPTKLTQEMQDQACTLFQAGHTVATVCEFIGIDECTYYDWMIKGDEGRKPYADFSKAIKEALATSKVVLLKAIAEDPAWQAKAWILERRFRAEWGRHLTMEHTGKDGGPLPPTGGLPPTVSVVIMGAPVEDNPYDAPPTEGPPGLKKAKGKGKPKPTPVDVGRLDSDPSAA